MNDFLLPLDKDPMLISLKEMKPSLFVCSGVLMGGHSAEELICFTWPFWLQTESELDKHISVLYAE